MATFRDRLPSRQESVRLFAASAFPVYSWAVFRYLHRIPAWQKLLGFRDMASILAYVFAFALLESCAVFLVLMLLYVSIPAPPVRERFVSKAATFVIVSALWAVVLQPVILSDNILDRSTALLCAALYASSVGASWTLVHRWELLATRIEGFVDRLTVFLYFYVPLSFLGIVVVAVRNAL